MLINSNFSPSQSYVGWVTESDSTAVLINGYSADDTKQPVSSDTVRVTSIKGDQINDRTTIRFARKLSMPSDVTMDVVAVEDRIMLLSYAWGSRDAFRSTGGSCIDESESGSSFNDLWW